MRIVYMGTPLFAAQILESLLACDGIEIIAVYAQPDRQAGRGKKLHEPETKVLAQSRAIPVYQPESFSNNPEALAELSALEPDILIVAAYGMLLPQAVLDIPKKGAFNVHASLLPRYRGAAPVQRALIAGDKITGTTIMRMEAGLDTGAILLQRSVPIRDDEFFSDTSESLLEYLAKDGASLMKASLDMIRDNRASFVEQNDSLATYAKKLTKQEALVDFSKSAEEIHNHVRGFYPNPGATSQLKMDEKTPVAVRIEKGYPLTRLESFIMPEATPELGQILGIHSNYIMVQTGKGVYGISQIRLAGKNAMDAKAFYNGYYKNYTSLKFIF